MPVTLDGSISLMIKIDAAATLLDQNNPPVAFFSCTLTESLKKHYPAVERTCAFVEVDRIDSHFQ